MTHFYGAGGVAKPPTGDTIKVTQISPGKLCGAKFAEWYAEASKEGGEIEKKRKEMCESKPGCGGGAIAHVKLSGTLTPEYGESIKYLDSSEDVGIFTISAYTEEYGKKGDSTSEHASVSKADGAPADSTGVVACITHKRHCSCYYYADDSSKGEDSENTYKSTIKYGKSFDVGPLDMYCGDEQWGPSMNGCSESYSVSFLCYTYD